MPQYMSDIPTITPDEDFIEIMECEYKGKHYSVRDNGAIMRHVRNGKPKRKDAQGLKWDDSKSIDDYCS